VIASSDPYRNVDGSLMAKDKYHIAALERGLSVLEAFSGESSTLSMTEIAEQAGLNKSTAFRVTYTLEELGYLKRDPETKRYRPGLKVLRLGFSALNSLEMGQVAQPFLKALSDQCGETTNMTVRDERDIVYVARNKTQQILSVDLHLGSRLPVYCTSMGKAQLIDLTPEELADLLGAEPYPRQGPNTITALDELMAELERVRRQGYALNDEELVAGLRAVAAPVRGHTNGIVGAINISVPSVRVSVGELEGRLAPMVVGTAQQVSLTLGARVTHPRQEQGF
jgi:IclR family pca regulon transcriptional regulator